jgi:O-antigen/teichoic acid export membrane protein
MNALTNYAMDLSTNITSPDFVALVLLWLARANELAFLEFGWNQVMVLLTYLVIPLSGIYVPMFSEIYTKGDKHKLQAAYATLTRVLLLLTVPAGVGFIVLAPAYFTLLRLAERFGPAIPVARVLVLCLFGESIVVVPHVILMVYERYRVVVLSRLLAVAMLPLIVIAAVRGDALTIALAVGGARFLSRAVLTPYLSRRWQLHFPWAFGARVLAPSLLAGLALWPLGQILPVSPARPLWYNALSCAVQLLAGALIFLIGFKSLGGLHTEDRGRLATMRLPLRRLLLKYL